MSINNRRKALALASAGAYGIAVYFTYQFATISSDQDASSTNKNNADRISKIPPSSSSSQQKCSCIPRTYTTDPKRTQIFQKIAQVYDDQINRDELAMGLPLLRRALLYFNAKGDVLEVGAGTGRNIDYYPSSVDKVVLTDLSDQMLMRARKKIQDLSSSQSKQHNSKFQVFVADASTMTKYYAEDSFDTVVDTFGLCSFDDPVQVLKELRRICKPSGKILLLEHGRTKSWQGLSNYLDKHAETHAKNWGCVWNRDIDLLLTDAGLEVERLDKWHFGTTYYAVCRPGNKVELRKEREEDEKCLHHNSECVNENVNLGKKIWWWKRLMELSSNRGK